MLKATDAFQVINSNSSSAYFTQRQLQLELALQNLLKLPGSPDGGQFAARQEK